MIEFTIMNYSNPSNLLSHLFVRTLKDNLYIESNQLVYLKRLHSFNRIILLFKLCI